ncbi:hypothetical protein L227DRAFT_283916 [Lentinus tigrinus ALCF2SS1-6]|uniref:Uncharacterized protein n=1 Tax=Lentinus tigrinus ALCF2SS1-6 TaxID=1328759 RepID=A0A5C2RZ12_9APHY|nr:hypothetical protein L227DRAFT_283916 [Lentinus tigrinus ALCF2SS1-6]
MNHWYPRLCRSTKMRCSRNTLCSVQLVDDYTMSLSSSTHPLDHLDPPIPSGPPTSTVNPNQSSSTSRPTISLRSDASATRSRSTWTLTGISQPTGFVWPSLPVRTISERNIHLPRLDVPANNYLVLRAQDRPTAQTDPHRTTTRFALLLGRSASLLPRLI